MTGKTKTLQLCEFGQSAWLDYISRSLIEKGKLKEMIDSGLRGMTSNPTIFDKSISSSSDYDEKIQSLFSSGKSTFEIYDDVTIGDIQEAADLFMPVYEETQRLDGYVSLEINPKLAFDTIETIEEGKRLFQKVNRPNVMFKVPSTEEGFQAVEELIASGINVNITLIFSLRQYIKTAHAYIRGIKRLVEENGDASKIRSVASVFVSRIDTVCDKLLDGIAEREQDQRRKKNFSRLKGKAAIANSALIYEEFSKIFYANEFKQLKENGANIQRVLWGSTSTKNPAYSDIKYVTELIAKDTINTMPQTTLEAFLDHGSIKEVLTGSGYEARKIISELQDAGIDINSVCASLLQDGVIAFEKSFESLLNSIEKKAAQLCKT